MSLGLRRFFVYVRARVIEHKDETERNDFYDWLYDRETEVISDSLDARRQYAEALALEADGQVIVTV